MKQLLVFLLFLCVTNVSAQDVIVKKDGSTIVCRVVELTSSEITYKKWSDLKGSNYVMNRADASAINYEDGKKVNLSEVTNLYKPGNQNDGVRRYNDRTLLQLDAISQKNDPLRKAKKYTTIGLVGGGLLAASGLVWILNDQGNNGPDGLGGGICIASGVLWTTSFLLIANHQRKKAEIFQFSSVYRYDFRFSNGSQKII